jgi:hypothetical protein
VVEAPLALEAAGGLCHAPHGNQQSENLPVGAVEVFNVREAGKVQAGGKCAQRQENGADERFLPQAEDQEEMMHNPFNVRCLQGVSCCARKNASPKTTVAVIEKFCSNVRRSG